MPESTPTLQKMQTPTMPAFISANPQQIEQQAVGMDEQAYGLSDADFKARYPELYQAQQTDLNNLNSEMSGNITPQMQNLWTRGGLTSALNSTGGWSLGSGTPGMANVARNLGIDQMGYQNQLQQQFQTANNTFRPRTFGLSGADSAQIALSNIAGQNNWNQANYAYNFEANQYNTGIANQQSVAAANANNAQWSNVTGAGGSAISALAIVAFG
jgi:hypothetical protein